MQSMKSVIVLTLCNMIVLVGCDHQRITVTSFTPSAAETQAHGHANSAKVAARLQELGYSQDEAWARVASMSADEIDYFATNPESIKKSGFIILGGLVGSTIASSIADADAKKAEEKKRLEDAQKEADSQRQHQELLEEIDEMKHQLSEERNERRQGELQGQIDQLKEKLSDQQ